MLNLSGGFYVVEQVDWPGKDVVRVVGNHFQFVERDQSGKWVYDPNWYPVEFLKTAEPYRMVDHEQEK